MTITATRRQRPAPSPREKLGAASVENLLSAGIAIGLFVISFDNLAFDGVTRYRTMGLALSGLLIVTALLVGVADTRAGAWERQERHARNLAVMLAATYFGWATAQRYFLQSDRTGAVQSLIAFLVVYASLAAELPRLLDGLRRWFLVIVAALLIPAANGQGFHTAERVWFSAVPGRYFGWSNPDNLSFIAGFAILLAVPVLRQRRGWVLAGLGVFLLLITAGNTATTAVVVALVAYLALVRVRRGGLLKFSIGAFALLTPAMLLWLPTDNALRVLIHLQAKYDLSGRTYLWANLVRSTKNAGHFWTGLGDGRVAFYTTSILDVYSAHSTLLQIILSGGFLTATLFVFVATACALRLLGAWLAERTQGERIALAVVVYWFVVSLTAIQPGTGLGFSVVIALAVARSSQPQPAAA